VPVIRKYCFCMNEKMDNNESPPITQWDKKNLQVRDACSREVGWRIARRLNGEIVQAQRRPDGSFASVRPIPGAA
jgi:hypothetical protein